VPICGGFGLCCDILGNNCCYLLLERNDIHVEVPLVEYEKLLDSYFEEASVSVQERLEAVREQQRVQFL
jgi:predicted ATPase with chaperone activity